MLEVGNNNNGNVHISNISLKKNDFLPCECCGIRFLSLEKYQVSPYCNPCISVGRKKNSLYHKRIGIVIASILSMLKVLENSSIKVLPDFFAPLETIIKGLLPYMFQDTAIKLLLPLLSIFLLVSLTFFIIVGGFQLIAYLDNRQRFPYH